MTPGGREKEKETLLLTAKPNSRSQEVRIRVCLRMAGMSLWLPLLAEGTQAALLGGETYSEEGPLSRSWLVLWTLLLGTTSQ